MVPPRSLLSSTLFLPSQDTLEPSNSRRTPVFGEPFRFGKPLEFDRSAPTYVHHGISRGVPLQLQLGISSQQQQENTSRRDTLCNKNNQLASAAVVKPTSQPPLQQQTNQQLTAASPSAVDGSGDNRSADSAAASTAAKYYLGSLGAALAHGLAPPAAAAAALAATAHTASQLALSAQLTASSQTTCLTNSGCNHSNHLGISRRLKQGDSVQPAPLGPAAAAAAIAASAACVGCPGCRMMLQRLQTCSQCTKPKQPSFVAGSATAVDNSAGTGVADAGSKALEGRSNGKRKACEVDDTPGPGQYNVPSSFGQGIAFSIGSKAAPETAAKATDDIPGPGSYYNPAGSSATGGPAFSIAGRWKQSGQDAAAPGPGEHQQLVYIVDGPAFTISSKRSSGSRQTGNSSPGPGAYAPDWDATRVAEGPAYSMGGRVAETRTRSLSPGPAEYQKTSFRPDGPAYSFPAKPKNRSKSATAADDGPAPTDYNTDSSLAASSKVKSAPAYSFSAKQTSTIDQMFKELFPGPGSYHVSDTGPSGPAFSMGSRSEGKKAAAGSAAEEPGPGDYYTESVLGSSGPAFSLAGKPSSPKTAAESDSLRGPGMYYNPQAEAALQGGKAFTIGTKLAVGEAAAGRDCPGPASYSLPAEQTGPAITIGSRPRVQDKVSDGPGPASYDLKPALPEGPCFTIGGKPHERPAADSDGPAVGEYEVVNTSAMEARGPAWTLGARRAAIEDKQAADIPGPGQYHSGAADSSGPAWSMAGRWVDPASDPEGSAVTPGPGEHYQEGWSSLGGPAFTLAGKAAVLESQGDTPGPGAYLAGDYKDPAEAGAPAFTMGTRPAPQEPADNLGPGAFDLPELPKGPAFTLGTRQAPSATADSSATPGPAAYDVAGAAAALDAATPAWTMGQRPKEQSAGGATPAPGDYDAAHPSAAAAPAWTMGTKAAAAAGTAAAMDQQLQPGPGYYTPVDPVRDDPGVAFSIGGKWKEAAAGGGDGPAPGEYEVPTADSGPAFTLAGRTAPQGPDAAAMPAPGQYHKPLRPGADTPAYTIAGKLTASVDAAAAAAAEVGPGSYDVTAAYVAAATAAPAFTLAGKWKLEGGAFAGVDSPGAGAYDVADAGPAGPAYSIGMRLATATKATDGPSCVDYNTEGALTSTTPSAPAYTMGAKPPQSTNPEDVTPAPGTYHGPATAGAPPNAPAAPAYSLQGKHKKGKSRLRQMLGKLVDLDASEPGPGEHQPTAGGSTAVSGPQFSFGPPAAAAAVAGASADVAAVQPQTLAELRAQLARLLVKETNRAAHKASKAAATAATQPEGVNTSNTVESQQHQARLTNKIGGLTTSNAGSDLASISASVHNVLLLSKSRRSKAVSSGNRHNGTDYTSPAPGDHHMPAAALSFGASGPAYSIAPKGNESSSIRVSVADADGFAAIMAAAAAADRVSAVPGPGAYHVEKPFPDPEGKVVYKPILKKSSSSGGTSKKVSFSGALS